MTEAERKLLIWCGVMLLRSTALRTAEADEIDRLIAEVRWPMPMPRWDAAKSTWVVDELP